MRIFDKEEKEIIRKITQGSGISRSLINIIDSMTNLQGTRIRINKTDRKAEFLFQIQSTQPTDEEYCRGIEKQKQITELLIKHLTLMRYLEKEELAVFFEPAKSTEQVITFGMGAVNMPFFNMTIDDQAVVDLLIKYVHKEIMPSPTLKQLENNRFLSDEEIKFNKQYLVTWIAIGVSILLGLYGMYNNYLNSKSQTEQFHAQLKENRQIADTIMNRFKKSEESRIDYRPAINKVSEGISEITDKISLAPENQTIKVKLLNQDKKNEK